MWQICHEKYYFLFSIHSSMLVRNTYVENIWVFEMINAAVTYD